MQLHQVAGKTLSPTNKGKIEKSSYYLKRLGTLLLKSDKRLTFAQWKSIEQILTNNACVENNL